MMEAKIALLVMSAVMFAAMLAIALAVCVCEMHRAAQRKRLAPRKRALYVEDLRHGPGGAQ